MKIVCNNKKNFSAYLFKYMSDWLGKRANSYSLGKYSQSPMDPSGHRQVMGMMKSRCWKLSVFPPNIFFIYQFQQHCRRVLRYVCKKPIDTKLCKHRTTHPSTTLGTYLVQPPLFFKRRMSETQTLDASLLLCRNTVGLRWLVKHTMHGTVFFFFPKTELFRLIF